MTESSRDARLVDAIIGVARTLDLEVTAEGVETAQQYDLLLRAGCNEAQGYYLARPMPAEAAKVFLSRYARDARPAADGRRAA